MISTVFIKVSPNEKGLKQFLVFGKPMLELLLSKDIKFKIITNVQ
jgi:hypothetical protein